MITTRWWWVRHAPVVNHQGRIYGRADVEADTGRDQEILRRLAGRLPAGAAWVVTPLRRTRQTAEALCLARPSTATEPWLVEPALMEQDFGDWQGLTFEEVQQRRPAEAHRFWVAPATEAPPNGESFAALAERVAAAVLGLSDRHPGRDLIAVAHGGTIRAALAQALGIDPEAVLRFSVANLSLTRIDALRTDEGQRLWRVESVNGL
jgi:alpha-ribazole phosphatase